MRAAPVIVLLFGCNAAFGVDELSYDDVVGAGGAPATTSSVGGGMGGAGRGGAGGAGGKGGAATTTTGGMGGTPADALTDEDLLARYFLDDAASNPATSLAEDAASEPLDLPIAFANGEPTWVGDSDGRRGLAWSAAGLDGGPDSMDANNKIFTALHGASEVTYEVVLRVISVHPAHSRFIDIGDSITPVFSLGTHLPDTVGLRVHNSLVRSWPVSLPSAGRIVLHLVVDLDAPEAERALLYRDGIQVDPVTLVGALNGPLDLSAATGFALGNRSASGLRSFEGELFYGAVYAAALTPERVAAHAQRLLISDDTDPR